MDFPNDSLYVVHFSCKGPEKEWVIRLQICFSKRFDGHTNLCGQVSNIFPSLWKTLQFAMALRCLDLAGKVLWGPQTVDTKMSCKDFRELVATALGVPLNRVSLVPLLILTDHGIYQQVL